MRTRLGAVAASALIVTTGMASSALAEPQDVGTPGSRSHAHAQDAMADRARSALAEVSAIFGHTPAGVGEVPLAPRVEDHGTHGREATLALRDLALSKSALTGQDRALADRFLARPTDGGQQMYGVAYETRSKRSCSTTVCVHYVRSGTDKVPLTDNAPENGVPDYVDFARGTMQSVHTSYQAAGFRSPKKDGQSANNGGDGRPDIYLADMPNGLYGFCTTDDPHINGGYFYYDVSAYCVLDNDYSTSEYGSGNTPAENFQVTAAHEYFHAVQFAYDVTEDSWFMEASATWAEDELFDDVNDNRGYLNTSPLAQPSISLDTSSGSRVYGDWMYFRYLSETFPSPELGGIATIVRDIWKLADASKAGFADGMETFSADAVRDAVAARLVDFPTSFSRFGADNRQPSLNYEEGAFWPAAPLSVSRTLQPSGLSTSVTRQLDHLSNATVRFTPSGLTEDGWQLELVLNLPDKFRGSAATVRTTHGATIETSPVPLDSTGGATVLVPFSNATTDFVEVTLTNASVRFKLATCYTGRTAFSCGGAVPKDDNLSFAVSATAVPPA